MSKPSWIIVWNKLWAPPTAVEDDGRAPRADHGAHFSKQIGEGFGQRGVDIPVMSSSGSPARSLTQ